MLDKLAQDIDVWVSRSANQVLLSQTATPTVINTEQLQEMQNPRQQEMTRAYRDNLLRALSLARK